MCLYPRLVKNPKYEKNKKNGGNIPPVSDKRVLVVPIACGNCIQCRKQKAREWQVRLYEEIKHDNNGVFVTLTFNDQAIKDLQHATITKRRDATDKQEIRIMDLEPYERDNAIATVAVRRFTERWRKEYKTSVKHWLVTELGHTGTENIHLHGIIWTKENASIAKHWQYGYVWAGYEDQNKKVTNYVTERTVNYIIKYILKIDPDHQYYKSKTLCSDGIGKQYITEQRHKRKKDETYRTSKGNKIALPAYYKNNIFTEHEREQLWIEKLDSTDRYINGIKIPAHDTRAIIETMKAQQTKSCQLGYGTPTIKWEQLKYERERREHLFKQRTK